MTRRIALIALGVVVFLVTLTVTVPAQQAYRMLPDGVPLDAWGVRGTLWQGQADTVIADGIQVDRLGWELDTSALWRGRLAYSVSGHIADGRFSGRVATRTGQAVEFSDVRADMSADALVRLVGTAEYPATLGGRLDAYIRHGEVNQGTPVRLDGIINWDNGLITALGETVALGSFAARVETAADGTLRGDLRNTEEGPLEVDGNVRLTLDGTMTGETRVVTTGAASEELLQGMAMLGIPDPEAELNIRFEGNINDPMGFQGRLE